jgi:hypothetical protein
MPSLTERAPVTFQGLQSVGGEPKSLWEGGHQLMYRPKPFRDVLQPPNGRQKHEETELPRYVPILIDINNNIPGNHNNILVST